MWLKLLLLLLQGLLGMNFQPKNSRNRIRFKSKNKWKNINFITIEENYHFKLNNQTTTEITEHGNEPNTPMDLPRYNNNMSNIVQRLEFEEDTPVVLTASTLLQRHDYKEYLPLGLVLHVLFQNDNWLYVRTAHGHEGYVCRNKCLPLDNSYCSPRTSNYHTNTLEMFKLIYEQDSKNTINYSERNIDVLYLQAVDTRQKQNEALNIELKNDYCRSIILTIKHDYNSCQMNTLSVKKGDVVVLVHSKIRGWFWVKNEQNEKGFIPAAVAGYFSS